MRSVVVLPQPDGPSSVTSVPWPMVNETSLTAAIAPYSLLTLRNSIEAAFIEYPCDGSGRRSTQLCHAWIDRDHAPAELARTDQSLDQPDHREHEHDQHRTVSER